MSALDNAMRRARERTSQVHTRWDLENQARRIGYQTEYLPDTLPAFDNESLTQYLIELHERLTALEKKDTPEVED